MQVKKGEKVYPEWVQEFRKPGTTIKQKGGSYYLYKRTSKRVPGKKYPQPVDTYIGIITPKGVIESGKKLVSLSSIEVKEYGFSKTVWEICPDSWKQLLGQDWEDVLAIILKEYSPNTYIEKDRTIHDPHEVKWQIGTQRASLNRRIKDCFHVTIKDLEILKSIYLVYIENSPVVSVVSGEQAKLLGRLGINLEVS